MRKISYLPKLRQLITTKLRPKPSQCDSESEHPTATPHSLSGVRTVWMLVLAPEAAAGASALGMLPGWTHSASGQKGFPARVWLDDLGFTHKHPKRIADHH